MRAKERGPSGFTLLELLVSVSIVVVLAGIAVPIVGVANEKGRQVREIQAARNAITGWLAYARDHDNSVLPGFKADPGARNAKGQALMYPINARYPFRLGPYLEYQFKGSLIVNEQAALTDDYSISGFPSLGLNVTFVGGDFTSSSDLVPSDASEEAYGKFAVSKLHEIHVPTRLIVFASSHFSDPLHGDMKGYHYVRSPNFWARRWLAEYQPGGSSWNYQFVDFRHTDRAVCAMADGHVEALGFDELEDMRRWSNQAAEADDPEWTMQEL